MILGVLWSTNLPRVEPRYNFVDLFCGEAQATKTAWLARTSQPVMMGETLSKQLSKKSFLLVVVDHINQDGFGLHRGIL